jgi:uncharacterized protein YndB with AHSA1/START domain
MMKWILVLLGVLVAAVAIAYTVGARLPQDHLAVVRARFAAPPDSVYDAITNVDAYPKWRKDVKSVSRLPARNGHTAWRETAGSGVLDYEATVAIRPNRVVNTIITKDAGFTGRWIFQILPDSTGSTLTVTEEGAVQQPIFRFLQRYVFGTHAAMETFLHSLGGRFGEKVAVTVLN